MSYKQVGSYKQLRQAAGDGSVDREAYEISKELAELEQQIKQVGGGTPEGQKLRAKYDRLVEERAGSWKTSKSRPV